MARFSEQEKEVAKAICAAHIKYRKITGQEYTSFHELNYYEPDEPIWKYFLYHARAAIRALDAHDFKQTSHPKNNF